MLLNNKLARFIFIIFVIFVVTADYFGKRSEPTVTTTSPKITPAPPTEPTNKLLNQFHQETSKSKIIPEINDEELTKLEQELTHTGEITKQEPPQIEYKELVPDINIGSKESAFFSKMSGWATTALRSDKAKAIISKVVGTIPHPEWCQTKKTQYHNNINLIIFEGDGERAECGQGVYFRKIGKLPNTNSVDDSFDNKRDDFTYLGDRDFIKGLELSIIGMKNQERKQVVIQSKFAYDDPYFTNESVPEGSSLFFVIKIKDLQASLKNTGYFKKFEEIIGDYRFIAACGDDVVVSVTIRDLNNNQLYTSPTPLTLRVGGSKTPIAITRILDDMPLYSKYFAIAHGKDLMRNYASNNLNMFQLNFNQNALYIIEIELFKINQMLKFERHSRE